MARARRRRRNPLEIVLLEDPKKGRQGSSAVGRRVNVNRRSGKTKAKGWGAELHVPNPWSVTIDARDLARYIGNRVLREIRKSFELNRNPETGAQLVPRAETRASIGHRGIADEGSSEREGLEYLLANLRRTWMGKAYPRGNRRINQKKATLKIYFSPGDRRGRGGFPNPAAAFNKLMAVLGIDQLGLGGNVERLIQESIDEWLSDVLSGRFLGVDTIDEAFGRR